MSEIRHDRLHDTHVIIAPERLHRPDFVVKIEESAEMKVCPFCEGNEAMTPKEIFAIRPPESFANSVGWKTRVVPNLYKAVAIEAPHLYHQTGVFEYWDGFGAHEVIIDTPRHTRSMAEWSHQEMVAWFKTLRQRVGDLRRDHRIVFMALFKNEGFDAGSTQSHCHTQLIGLPLVPKSQREVNRRSREYLYSNHKGLFESIVNDEEEAEMRMIERVGEFSAFCPFASSYPFEVMIGSKNHSGQIDSLGDTEMEDLASLLSSVIQRLTTQLNPLSFNLSISSPPLGEDAKEFEAYRLVIRIMPRLYRFGGFEVNTEMMINPVAPELAAKLLRGEYHA